MAKDSVKRALAANQTYLRTSYAITLLLNFLFYGYHFFFAWPMDRQAYLTGVASTCLQLLMLYLLKSWAAPVIDAESGDISSCNALVSTQLPRMQSTFQDCLWVTWLTQFTFVVITRVASYALILVPILCAYTLYQTLQSVKSTISAMVPQGRPLPQQGGAPSETPGRRIVASDAKRERRQALKEKRMGIASAR